MYKRQLSDSTPATEADNEEFRRVIWSLCGQGTNQAYWSGAFRWPVEGASIFQPYGAYLTDEGSAAGRSANLTLLCPTAAAVVSVDPAALTRGGSDGLFYRPAGDELM